MDMKSAMIIYNPAAGREQGEDLALRLNEALRLNYPTLTLLATEQGGDAKRYANAASRNHYQSIYVIGGDGTVNEVVNGIAEEDHRPSIGIVPGGTVNNLSKMLHLPQRPKQAIQALVDAPLKRIDIGRVNDQYFCSTLSTGPIPETAKEVSADLKTSFGPFAYVMEGLQALRSDKTMTFRLTLDGQQVEANYSLLAVGLGNSIMGIPSFFPQAQLDDGYLNLMGLGPTTPIEKLSLIPELFSQNSGQTEDLVVGRYQTIGLETPDGSIIESTVDGDQGPASPLTISLLPKHLSFYCGQ